MSASTVAGTATVAEPIPFRRDDARTFDGSGFVAAAIVLIGVGAFAIWALRRKLNKPGGGNPRFPWLVKVDVTQSPRSIGRTAISPQVTLHVIEWRGEEILIGCTSHSVSVLSRHPASPSEATGEKVAP